MVSLLYSHRVNGVLESTQCDIVDKEQAISLPPGVSYIHLDCYPSAALLGPRNLRQLRLLPEGQLNLPDHPAYGATFPVELFGNYGNYELFLV